MPSSSFVLSRVLPPIAVALVWLQCAKGGTEPNLVDVTGHWEFVEQFSDPVHQVTCSDTGGYDICLLYTSPSPRDGLLSRMPSSA